MVSFVFYGLYFMMFLLSFTIFANDKVKHLSIMPFLFFPHFNNICLLKLGLTFSFLEMYMFIVALFIFISSFNYKRAYKKTVADEIFYTFLVCSIISIIIAQIRISVGDLVPSPKIHEVPILRSFMSLNKLFVFILILPYIRNYYVKNGIDLTKYFKKYLALSAIFPTIAVFLQAMGIDFTMLFNNPSFAEESEWKCPNRPFGLSYEASFYALLCFFSFIGVYYAQKEKILKNGLCNFLYIFYLFGVVLSISRTGLLAFVLFAIIKNRQKLSIKKIIVLIFLLIVLANVTIMGFGIFERFSSSFNTEADASNIERFGSTFGLVNLLFEKGLFLGVGIFNYYFYLYDYMPKEVIAYMDFDKSSKIVSFNMVIQIMAEFGLPLFYYFIHKSYKLLTKDREDSFCRDWFFYFLFLSLSVQMLNFSMPYIVLLYGGTNISITVHSLNKKYVTYNS